MAEVSQLKFDLKEVGRLLLEKQGIKSGKWVVGFNFNIVGVEAGPTPEQTRPGMVVSVEHFMLTAAQVDGPMVIDLSKPADGH